MKKIIIIFLGLAAFFSSCENDGEEVQLPDTVIGPEIITLPDLTLKRENGTDTIAFLCSPVDPGFTASATYYLEASLADSGFNDALQLYSGISADTILFAIIDLNQAFLASFTEDETTSTDFRLRAVLTVDAGTGAPGTGDDLFEYTSETVTTDVTLFGLPRLDLIDSGVEQKLVSPLEDGFYSSYVKLDESNPFTLLDPETSTTYGDNSGALAINGNSITPVATGYHYLFVDINNLEYTLEEYQIGLVGSATPNGWDAPDSKMDYDLKSGTWYITTDLVAGEIKFRKNDAWGWNLGGTTDNLEGGGDNYPIEEDGNYTITLTITSDEDPTGTFTIVKN